MTNDKTSYLTFSIDSIDMALPINQVIKIVPLPKLLLLPDLPKTVIGLLNFKGELFPVFDLRVKFNLPLKKLKLDQYVLLGKTGEFRFGILTDQSFTHIDNINSIESTGTMLMSDDKKTKYFKHNDGVVYLSDPKEFLSVEEMTIINDVIDSTDEYKV